MDKNYFEKKKIYKLQRRRNNTFLLTIIYYMYEAYIAYTYLPESIKTIKYTSYGLSTPFHLMKHVQLFHNIT